MNFENRWKRAKEAKLCYRCLKSNHIGKKCRFQGKCNINGCEKTHNRLLHREKSELNASAEVFEPQHSFNGNSYPESYSTSENGPLIALRTIPVMLKSKSGREIKINALLDDGSTTSYLNEDVASEIGLSGEKCLVNVNVINGKTETFETSCVDFIIKSENRSFSADMSAQTTKNVTGRLKPVDWRRISQEWTHLQGIRFPTLGKRSKVDLLIGLDYVELHRSLGDVEGQAGEPVARLTPLGWTCVGPVNKERSTLFSFHSQRTNIDQTLQKFWEVENVGLETSTKMSPKDKNILEKAEAAIRFQSDHYEVSLPWKDNKKQLVNNDEMAIKRLVSTEKRLDKDPVVKEMYNETIEKYLQKDYIEKVDKVKNEEKWLMPHFPVVRLDRESTKVRIVFDASARHEGLSLNDVIEQGPKLQNSLFDVLMRFRKNKIAVACDIQEMYLRIVIVPQDRKFHRFLWRSSKNEDPNEYEFKRLVFGVSASPFLAQLVSRHNAKLYQKEYPLAAETVLLSTYMDDSMDSVENEKKGIELYKELNNIWAKAGMFPHKWISNSKVVLECIPVENRAQKVDLTKKELPRIKTLGVLWEAENDMFKFDYNPFSADNEISKRDYLKKIATLFDPLGFLAPYLITAKILMQDVWISKIDWDEPIETETSKNISEWFDELPKVSEIKMPRCLTGEKK